MVVERKNKLLKSCVLRDLKLLSAKEAEELLTSPPFIEIVDGKFKLKQLGAQDFQE
jgi:hypothetical protein